MLLAEEIQAKWAEVLDHPDLPTIDSRHKRAVTAVVLENVEKELGHAHQTYGGQQLLGEAAPVNQTGSNIDNFDPVLISLVRRAMPNLISFDIMGTQPMTGPSGLVFAMRSRYSNQTGQENFYNEVLTDFSTVVTGANTLGQKHTGTLPGVANNAEAGLYNYGTAMATAQAEALGTSGNTAFPEMGFSIEKVTVTAKSRALKAEYTQEMAQDLKAIHGLDAESELANILQGELLAEINREAIRTVLITAKPGAQLNTTTAGVFDLDTDSNGRWLVEKFKGLMFQVERECNQIAKETRRGKGNIVICSSDVASALQAAGVLDYAPALNSNALNVDDTGSTFAGVLNGRIKVYIDPYAIGGNYMVIGYKGSNAFDAGLFYCPYVPLQMVRAVDPGSFQPKIGFKTRYGMVSNPYAEGDVAGLGAINKDSNVYYRRVIVNNLM